MRGCLAALIVVVEDGVDTQHDAGRRRGKGVDWMRQCRNERTLRLTLGFHLTGTRLMLMPDA